MMLEIFIRKTKSHPLDFLDFDHSWITTVTESNPFLNYPHLSLQKYIFILNKRLNLKFLFIVYRRKMDKKEKEKKKGEKGVRNRDGYVRSDTTRKTFVENLRSRNKVVKISCLNKYCKNCIRKKYD